MIFRIFAVAMIFILLLNLRRQHFLFCCSPSSDTAVDDVDGSNSNEVHKHRSKRSFWDGFEFNLRLPSYEWTKTFGGSAIGASIGLTLVNQFELKICEC